MTQLGDGEVASCSAVSAAEKIGGIKLSECNNDIDLFYMKNLELSMDECLDERLSSQRHPRPSQHPQQLPRQPERTSSSLNLVFNNNEAFDSLILNTPGVSSADYAPYLTGSNNNGNYISGCPGMKDVGTWLKTLRLHKYTNMIQDLSYDDMMNLDDRKLEARKVTKGARKKILQSLEKLRDRVPLLRDLEKNLDERSDLSIVIAELRSMMNTPINAFNDPYTHEIQSIDDLDFKDLPGHMAFVCYRIYFLLYSCQRILDIEDDYILKMLQVYEKICINDCFTYRQRQQAMCWKKQLRKSAVERNLLPGNNMAYVQVGYAGFNRRPSRIMSHRSSTTSPPESSCAVSPPPMPQSNSAPPHTHIGQSRNFDCCEEAKQERTLPSVERASIIKSRSSPDNSNLIKSKTGQPTQLYSYMHDPEPQPLERYMQKQKELPAFGGMYLRQSRIAHKHTPQLPPLSPPQLPPQQLRQPQTTSKYAVPSTSMYLGSVQGLADSAALFPSPPSRTRSYQLYNGRQSDPSPRVPSNTSSGFSSDRSSGAGSPTSQYRPLFGAPAHYSHNMTHVR